MRVNERVPFFRITIPPLVREILNHFRCFGSAAEVIPSEPTHHRDLELDPRLEPAGLKCAER